MTQNYYDNGTYFKDGKAKCPICGIERDEATIGGPYRIAYRKDERSFWPDGYAPEWDSGLMWNLPDHKELPICTDRRACRSRATRL